MELERGDKLIAELSGFFSEIKNSASEKQINQPVNAGSGGELIAELRDLISEIKKPAKSDMWDASDIAAYLRLTKGTVQSHLLGKHGFPNAIVLPVGGRRWLASEVKAWAARHR